VAGGTAAALWLPAAYRLLPPDLRSELRARLSRARAARGR
jgi:hypothetical protein